MKNPPRHAHRLTSVNNQHVLTRCAQSPSQVSRTDD